MLMAAMIAVAGILVAGIALFVAGGSLNRRHANRLMMFRVGMQAVAVMILGLLLLIGRPA